MLFNTYTYAVFLPLVLLAYLALPLRGRQYFLLASSYLFYCWETPIYGVLLLISTLLDYACGLGLEKYDANPKARKLILTVSLTGNLTMLSFFKYADFLGANFAGLGQLLGFHTTWTPMHFLLPVGISFYTFQTMSYAIEVYRRQIKANPDFISFALYVSFFPQLVAGPIERASHLMPQLMVRQKVTMDDIKYGLTRIILGLFRKLVIADRFAIMADHVFASPGSYPTFTVWLGMLSFGLQIYHDFAGYSDIAIGSARLFGVHIMENFRRPLISKSMADFWNRWHISLTSWFRDYLFLPLGGFRKGGLRAIINGSIVLTLCGLWHGASWHFVFWGVYHAALMSLYYLWKFFQKRMGWKRKPGERERWLFPSILLTYLLVEFSLVFFRSADMIVVGQFFQALVGLHAGAGLPNAWYAWVVAGFIVICYGVEFLQEYGRLNERIARWPWWLRVLGMSFLVVLLIVAAVNNDVPYIYFQF
jgi:alginate O-acetyltransferase complex protein AlgI